MILICEERSTIKDVLTILGIQTNSNNNVLYQGEKQFVLSDNVSNLEALLTDEFPNIGSIRLITNVEYSPFLSYKGLTSYLKHSFPLYTEEEQKEVRNLVMNKHKELDFNILGFLSRKLSTN